MSAWSKPVGAALVAVCFFNLVVGAIAWVTLHGSAINGKIENGLYYVGYQGKFTEVSERVYTFSFWQGVSELVTFALGFVGVLLLRPLRRKPQAAEPRAEANRPRD